MNIQRIILILIASLVAAGAFYFLFEDATAVQTVIVAVLCLLIGLSLSFKSLKGPVATKQEPLLIEDVKVTQFVDALGGVDNIITVGHEVSRVKVQLKDVDQVKQEEIRELQLDGIFLSGNQIQANFGGAAEGVATQIQGKMS